jgi:hypothetical protein
MPVAFQVGTNLVNTSLDGINDEIQNAVSDLVSQTMGPRLLQDIHQFIPTRSGKLYDELIQFSKVMVERSQMGLRFTFFIHTPQNYPLLIENPKHSGQIGWGYRHDAVYLSPLVNKLRDTEKGAYFLLNDPQAESDYISIFTLYMSELMFQMLLMAESTPWRGTTTMPFEIAPDITVSGQITTKRVRGTVDVEAEIFDVQLGGTVDVVPPESLPYVSPGIIQDVESQIPGRSGMMAIKGKDQMGRKKELYAAGVNMALGEFLSLQADRAARYIWNVTFTIKGGKTRTQYKPALGSGSLLLPPA